MDQGFFRDSTSASHQLPIIELFNRACAHALPTPQKNPTDIVLSWINRDLIAVFSLLNTSPSCQAWQSYVLIHVQIIFSSRISIFNKPFLRYHLFSCHLLICRGAFSLSEALSITEFGSRFKVILGPEANSHFLNHHSMKDNIHIYPSTILNILAIVPTSFPL